MRLVLASSSPRRRMLLETLGHEVIVRPSTVDETPLSGESAEALVLRLARAKAHNVSSEDGLTVLAADTVVELDGAVLGKPRDDEHARALLARLAGRAHRVWTGFCARTAGGAEHAGVVCSEVRMRSLTPAEIAAFVATGAAAGKAGAYGIQDHGAALVESVTGSHSNVVGLPLDETLAALAAVM